MMDRGRLGIKPHWNERGEEKEEGCVLIGRVLAKIRVGYAAVRGAVGAAWRVAGELEVKSIGFNMYSFTFPNVGEADRVLQESPWVVRNYMLSLIRRKPFLSDNEIQINTCEFWIQFHNIPPEGRIVSNIRLMAEEVGRIIEVEDPKDRRFITRGFERARVEVDVDKPLVPGFLAPRPDGLDDVWIKVKYEKLARLCFSCGRLGHESRTCEEEEVTVEAEEGNRGYDSTLCAQAYRWSDAPVGRKNLLEQKGRGGVHGGKEALLFCMGKSVLEAVRWREEKVPRRL